MRPRIFSLMLTAFALVIVLGVGGMVLFVGITVTSFNREWERGSGMGMMSAQREARRLGELYSQSGSWNNADNYLNMVVRELELDSAQQAVVVDNAGIVVATTDPRIVMLGQPLPPIRPIAPRPPARGATDFLDETGLTQTLPIRSNGQQVGTLVLFSDTNTVMQANQFDGGRLVRGFLGAGLVLIGVLLSIAAFFSSRISRPLRQVTGAAQALAAGDMNVRVQQPAVHELSELAGAFNAMADTLVRADQQRRQLTADVAHELRTPLAIVKGRLEGIQDGVYSADNAQIDGLLSEVALLERLIDDLRLLALAEAGQLALYREAVDPAALTEAIQRAFTHEAAERGIELALTLSEPLPEFNADPQRVSQVLSNLVSNALRHTPRGGRIVIAVRLAPQPTAAYLHFAVSDTGQGIEPEHVPHVFDRFYRVDRARTRSGGGAGLGLAIARQIVEAHGGTIWADSTPGQGTTMTFRLPVGQADGPPISRS